MLVLLVVIGLFATPSVDADDDCSLTAFCILLFIVCCTDYAIEFPNKDVTDYVHIWGMPKLTEFTVCFWMKSNDSNHGTPFSYAVPEQANELLIIGYDSFNVRIGGTLRELSVSANDGYWHHICSSWENKAGSLKFYKDGVLSTNHTNFKTGYTIRSGGSLVLGQDQDSLAGDFDSGQSFQGLLSNLNMWDYVLCPDEIARISKVCLSEEPGSVYKWADLEHGVKGKPRVLIPSPCDPLASVRLTQSDAMGSCSVDTCSDSDESSAMSDYALEFPNKDVTDYVHIWGMPNLTEFTVCFWMKSNDSNHGTPFSYAVPEQANELLIIGYESFNVTIGGTLRRLSVSANDNKWHHICLTWQNSNGSLKFYKDSIMSANHTDFMTGFTIRSGGSLVLGQDQDSLAGGFQSSQSFQGLLANLNVWDFALCPAAISRMSKACLSEEYGVLYKWSDLKHGIKGKPRVLIPSPCHPLDEMTTVTSTIISSSTMASIQSQQISPTTMVDVPATSSTVSTAYTAIDIAKGSFPSDATTTTTTTDIVRATTTTLGVTSTEDAASTTVDAATAKTTRGVMETSTAVDVVETISTTSGAERATTYADAVATTAGVTVATTKLDIVRVTTPAAERAATTSDAREATTTSDAGGATTTAVESIVTTTAELDGATVTTTVDTVGWTSTADAVGGTSATGVEGPTTATTTGGGTVSAERTTVIPSSIAGSKGSAQSSGATASLTVNTATATATARTGNTDSSAQANPSSIEASSTKNIILPTGLGPEVIITLNMKNSCTSNTFVPSTTQYKTLKTGLSKNVRILYKQLRLKKVHVKSLTCAFPDNIRAVVNVTFGTGNTPGTSIEKMLEDEINDGFLLDMPVDSTEFNVKFNHVTLGFEIKDGECKKVCCGAGGPVVMVQTCSPPNRCEGIGNFTKEEAGHCPGEGKDTCQEQKCDGGTSNSPSFAIIGLLTIVTLLRMAVN